MKFNINAEHTGNDTLEFFLAQLKDKGVVATAEDIKVEVFSEKGQKYIDFKPEHIRFIYNK